MTTINDETTKQRPCKGEKAWYHEGVRSAKSYAKAFAVATATVLVLYRAYVCATGHPVRFIQNRLEPGDLLHTVLTTIHQDTRMCMTYNAHLIQSELVSNCVPKHSLPLDERFTKKCSEQEEEVYWGEETVRNSARHMISVCQDQFMWSDYKVLVILTSLVVPFKMLGLVLLLMMIKIFNFAFGCIAYVCATCYGLMFSNVTPADFTIARCPITSHWIKGPDEIGVYQGHHTLYYTYIVVDANGQSTRMRVLASQVEGSPSYSAPTGGFKECPMSGSTPITVAQPTGILTFSVMQSDGTPTGTFAAQSIASRIGFKASKGYPASKARDFLVITVHQWESVKDKFSLTNAGKTMVLDKTNFSKADIIIFGTRDEEDVVLLKGPVISKMFTMLGVQSLYVSHSEIVGTSATVYGVCNKTGNYKMSVGRVQTDIIHHKHQCSTEPGYSGSPLIVNGQVIGIHTGGFGRDVHNEATNIRTLFKQLNFVDSRKGMENTIISLLAAYKIAETPTQEARDRLEWMEEKRARAEEEERAERKKEDEYYNSQFEYDGERYEVEYDSTHREVTLGPEGSRGHIQRKRMGLMENARNRSFKEGAQGITNHRATLVVNLSNLAAEQEATTRAYQAELQEKYLNQQRSPEDHTEECILDEQLEILTIPKHTDKLVSALSDLVTASEKPIKEVKESKKKKQVKKTKTVSFESVKKAESPVLPTIVEDKAVNSTPAPQEKPPQPPGLTKREKRAAREAAAAASIPSEAPPFSDDIVPGQEHLTTKLSGFQKPTEVSDKKAEPNSPPHSSQSSNGLTPGINPPVQTDPSSESKQDLRAQPKKVKRVKNLKKNSQSSANTNGPPSTQQPKSAPSFTNAELISLQSLSPKVIKKYLKSLHGNTQSRSTQKPSTPVQA
jgi:hypothetical protein